MSETPRQFTRAHTTGPRRQPRLLPIAGLALAAFMTAAPAQADDLFGYSKGTLYKQSPCPYNFTSGGTNPLFASHYNLSFWGTYWSTATGKAKAAALVFDNKAIISAFDRLFRTAGYPVASVTTITDPFPSIQDLGMTGAADVTKPTVVSTTAFESILTNLIAGGAYPKSTASTTEIYVIVLPPGIADSTDRTNGYGGRHTVTAGGLTYAMIENTSDENQMMRRITHEVQEAITDPPGGRTSSYTAGGRTRTGLETGDACDGATGFIQGIQITPIWAQSSCRCLGGAAPKVADNDGDGFDDYFAFRFPNVWVVGQFKNSFSSAGPYTEPGASWGIPMIGDRSGSGQAEFWVYNSSGFTVWNPRVVGSTNIPLTVDNGLPTLGDFDGDGRADAALVQPAPDKSLWYFDTGLGKRIDPTWVATPGTSWHQTVPLAADCDGDGKSDLIVYDAITGFWFVHPSNKSADYKVQWGGDPSDWPLVGDINFDGREDLIIYRASEGNFYVAYSKAGGATPSSPIKIGHPWATPVVGAYDGLSRPELGVFESGTWTILKYNGTFRTLPVAVGDGSDIAVPSFISPQSID